MDWIVLLPILAFIALASGLIVVFRRTGRIVARTRETEGFRSSVRDLCAADRPVARRAPPRASTRCATTSWGPTRSATRSRPRRTPSSRYIDEARALHGPPAAVEIREDLVLGLERAGRALATVEHGTTIMTSVRGGARELEAQTSIKRGYLNLIHARDAIARQALLADGLTTRPDRT